MDCRFLICPICGQPLSLSEGAIKCGSGHSFDIAKEGYVNLLPANAKKSALPGDNKLMVNARRDFLSRGYFEPLAEEIAVRIGLPDAILDAGCGTGYYSAYVKETLARRGKSPFVCGVDISKFAVAKAAKTSLDCTAVGSVFSLPVCDNAFDCVLSVFAPLSVEEAYRVTTNSATIVTVCPAEKHLFELKKAMYGDATYENPPENAQKPLLFKNGEQAFAHTHTVRKTFTRTVDGSGDIEALLSMTPYAYKTPEDKKQRLLSLPQITCTFDFYLSIYQKV